MLRNVVPCDLIQAVASANPEQSRRCHDSFAERMAVSHPLLRKLKAHVKSFIDTEDVITDDHPALLPFCQTVEDIFNGGFVVFNTKWSYGKVTVWQFVTTTMCDDVNRNISLRHCVQYALQNKSVLTDTGRLRLCIRATLGKHLLATFARLLIARHSSPQSDYEMTSVIGDEILAELFVSLLSSLVNCQFALNLKNAAFLDTCWNLPLFRVYELVPCAKIGINVKSKDGFLVVTYVEPDSVADEDAKIELGDVIQSIYDINLRNGTKRQLASMIAACKDMPIVLTVVKCIGRDDKLYMPLCRIVQELGFSTHELLAQHRQRLEELSYTLTVPSSSPPQKDGPSCSCTTLHDSDAVHTSYLGSVDVKGNGAANRLGMCIVDVVQQKRERRAVTLHVGPLGVMAVYDDSEQVLFSRGYPEISACGRRLDRPTLFAFIVGEAALSDARKFVCYVFETDSEALVKAIIEAVSKGFERTHWAV